MQVIKKGIKKLLKETGYDIVKSNSKKSKKKHQKSGKNKAKVTDKYLYENYSEQALKEKRFYNVGAGNFFHPYWTNVDYGTNWYEKIQHNPFIEYNLMECSPLPLEDNVAEIIYTSHTIEHVTNQAILNLFKEAYRVLKPGGGIRIICPDARRLYETIASNDLLFWKPYYTWMDFKDRLDDVTIFDFVIREIATSRCRFYRNKEDSNILTVDAIKELYESLDYRDFCHQVCSTCSFRDEFPGDHINWWDENKIRDFLEDAGFTNVYVSRYGQSKFPPLRNTKFFDYPYFMLALYIEAQK